MRNVKRTLALLLTLCMVIPMCLVNLVSAEAATYSINFAADMEPLFNTYTSYAYDKFQDKKLEDGTSGQDGIDDTYVGVTMNSKTGVLNNGALRTAWETLYNGGYIDYRPIISSSDAIELSWGSPSSSSDKAWFLKSQKTPIGSWFALEVRMPAAGTYTVSLDQSYGSDNYQWAMDMYFLPASTATKQYAKVTDAGYIADNAAVSALLTDENKLGTVTFDQKVATWSTVSADVMKDGAAATLNVDAESYLVVFKIASDPNGGTLPYIGITGMNFTLVENQEPSTEPTETEPAEPVYEITVDGTISGGSVTTDVKSAKAGDTVNVTVTADIYKEFANLFVVNGENLVPFVVQGDGKFSFVMPEGNVSITAAFTKLPVEYNLQQNIIDAMTASGNKKIGDNMHFTNAWSKYYVGESNRIPGVMPLAHNGYGNYARTYWTKLVYEDPDVYFTGIYGDSGTSVAFDKNTDTYLAMLMRNPGAAGTYSLDLTVLQRPNSSPEAEVYVIPASQIMPNYDIWNMDGTQYATIKSNISSALTTAECVGTVDFLGANASSVATGGTGSKYETAEFNINVELGSEEFYVVVVKAVKSAKDVPLREGYSYNTKIPVGCASMYISGAGFSGTKYVAIDGTPVESDIAGAIDLINNAAEGSVITLLDNIVVADAEVILPDGVFLDLNGFNLTVASVVSTNAHVVDTATMDDDGLRGKLSVTGSFDYNPKNKYDGKWYVPMKNDDGTYSIFKVGNISLGNKPITETDNVIFGYRLVFDDSYAYSLLGKNGNDVTAKVTLKVGDEVVAKEAFFKAETVSKYIGLEQTAEAGKIPALMVTIKNVSLAGTNEINVQLDIVISNGDNDFVVGRNVNYTNTTDNG